MSDLTKLPHVTWLHLGSTLLTDEGLMKLAPMKQLQTLIVTRTEVTDDGAAKLAQELPKTKIQHIYIPAGES